MQFLVKLKTNRGGLREVELTASSVQDAIDQAKESYKDCVIRDVDLIPKSRNSIRLYSHGDQTECDASLIYRPFEK